MDVWKAVNISAISIEPSFRLGVIIRAPTLVAKVGVRNWSYYAKLIK